MFGRIGDHMSILGKEKKLVHEFKKTILKKLDKKGLDDDDFKEVADLFMDFVMSFGHFIDRSLLRSDVVSLGELRIPVQAHFRSELFRKEKSEIEDVFKDVVEAIRAKGYTARLQAALNSL